MSNVMNEQVGGDHYKKKKIQPWDIIDEYDLDYYHGNVIKYVLRDKDGHVEDLKKAKHYIDKIIANTEQQHDFSSFDKLSTNVLEAMVSGSKGLYIDQLSYILNILKNRDTTMDAL